MKPANTTSPLLFTERSRRSHMEYVFLLGKIGATVSKIINIIQRFPFARTKRKIQICIDSSHGEI